MRTRVGAALMVVAALDAGCSLAGLEGGIVDASAPDGSAGDAGVRTENCTNGVDDDGNGLIDCADPACTAAGFACTAATIPPGWTLVAFSETTRPLCPAAYDAEQAVVSGVRGADDACGCTCSGGPAVCAGTATYNQYPNACATGAAGVNVGVNNGACSPISTSINAGDSYQLYYASTAVAQQGACSGAGTVMAAPAPTFNAGATCAAPSELGAGCATGVCAPPTGAAFKACIAHPGTMACPTFGYTELLLASTGTPGWVDMRTCGACPCATSITCGAVSSVAVYSDGACTAGGYGINTGCGFASASEGIGSYRVAYASGGDPACQPTGASAPGGSVTLDANVETICCTPDEGDGG